MTTIEKIIIGLIVLSVCSGIGCYYVAFHFISKFW